MKLSGAGLVTKRTVTSGLNVEDRVIHRKSQKMRLVLGVVDDYIILL